MLSFAGGHEIHLTASWSECPCILSSYSEQEQFSDVAEVEADASPIRTTIFSDFVPHNVALVLKAPALHDLKSVWQKRVWNPEI